MAKRYDIKDGDDATAETFNRVFSDVDLRLGDLEKAGSALQQAKDEIVRLGLTQINVVIADALSSVANITELSDFFRADSESEITLGLGVKEIIIEEGDRENFAAPLFVAVAVEGQLDNWMAGQTQSWNKETGQLYVNVTHTKGSGTFSDWVVTATQHPETGPTLDAYTKSETDTAIAQAKSDLLGGAPDAALDTLTELADALADDANFAATITTQLASKSNAGHSHAIADVTGLQNALDAKQDAGDGGGGGFEVGDIKMTASSSVENDWMLCDGRELSRATYAALFAKIGTSWGAGNGSTTFNIPPMSGRAPVGAGQGGGLTNRPLGSTGGAEIHALSLDEMPSHNHSYSRANHTTGNNLDGKSGTAYSQSNSGVSTGSKGGNQPHNNVQPFAAVNFIIKVA